jgi:hypothetical protein
VALAQRSLTAGARRKDPEAGLAQAVAALGWRAECLLDVEVLGARLVVAATPDRAELAARDADRLGPLADPWLFRVRADDDPELLTRPAPVRIAGALAVRRSWPAARAAAGTFTAFGPRAVLLPRRAVTRAALTEAAVIGIGVLTADDATLLLPAGPPPPVPRSHVHRLVEELVYASYLERPEASEPLPEHQVARHLPGHARQGQRLVLELG